MAELRVPFLDLKAHHDPLRDEILAAIAAVAQANAFAGGPFVEEFERDFARYCGTRHCIGVGNGTDSLWFALLALGIGPGDEVVVPAMTFIATAEAVSFTGARPVFADVDPATYTLSPERLEAALTPRTKAIIPVHLFGQCADMDAIHAVAAKRGLPVIEDAAQAQGATYRGRRAGGLGRAGSFSFYPGKNLGAWGEAGAVTTDDDDLAARIRMLRDHGQSRKYLHQVVGWNGRMDGIQGAVLRIKLRHLDRGNAARRAAARDYDRLLAGLPGVVLPVEAPAGESVHHIYAVQVPARDTVLAQMGTRGIGCGIHYPVPLHLQPAYAGLGHREGDFPVSEACGRRFLSLPMFPELTAPQREAVAAALKASVAAST